MIIHNLVYLLLLVITAIVDYRTFKIPNLICVILLFLAVINPNFQNTGAMTAFLLSIPICILLRCLDIAGYGDIKYIMANCFYLGVVGLFGVLISFLIILIRKIVMQKEGMVAYAPYFAIGFTCALFIKGGF